MPVWTQWSPHIPYINILLPGRAEHTWTSVCSSVRLSLLEHILSEVYITDWKVCISWYCSTADTWKQKCLKDWKKKKKAKMKNFDKKIAKKLKKKCFKYLKKKKRKYESCWQISCKSVADKLQYLITFWTIYILHHESPQNIIKML